MDKYSEKCRHSKGDIVRERGLAGKNPDRYTYGDYLTWADGQRYELIDGVVYIMSPAPSRRHQEISMELSRQFSVYLFDKDCKIYAAPFDVRLPEGNEKDEDVTTVVQPDLLVVCDLNKLDDRGLRGAPDLVIEILTPESGGRDKKIKRALYEKHGVKEYWIVNYNEKTVDVYLLNDENQYGKPDIYFDKDKVPITIFEDLEIDLSLVFQE
jgi:Uma2 family endonuclease